MAKSKCEKGYHWCPVKEECVSDEEEKNKGKGPMGMPKREDITMSKIEEGNKLVDQIFDEGFEIFGKVQAAERKVDELLISEKGILPKPDSFDKSIMDVSGRPYDNPTKFKYRPNPANVDVDVDKEENVGEDWPYGMGAPIEDDVADDEGMEKEEPAEKEDPKKVQNSLNNVPNQKASVQKKDLKQDVGMVDEMVDKIVDEILNPAKVALAPAKVAMGALKIPVKAATLPVKGAAKMVKRSVNKTAAPVKKVFEGDEAYQKHFKRMMKMSGVSNPSQFGSDKEKKDFFNKVDKSWKAKNE